MQTDEFEFGVSCYNAVAFNMPRGDTSSSLSLLLKQVRFMTSLFSVMLKVNNFYPPVIFFSCIFKLKQSSSYTRQNCESVIMKRVLIFSALVTLDFCRILYKMYVTAIFFRDVIKEKHHHRRHLCKECFLSQGS